MEVTLGCSIDTLRTNAAFREYQVINVENPLYPGYLEHNYGEDLQYLSREIRQRLIIDGPYIDLNLGSPEPKARQLAQEKALEAIAFARQCGAEEIVFLSTFLPFIGLASYEQGWIMESLKSWQAIVESESDIRISLCNTFEYEPTNLIEIVETLNQPRLGLAFDVGHCLVWGKMDVIAWYRRIRDRCRVVYVHSNDGQADAHQSIRTGKLAELGLLQRLRAELRADSIVILKYFEKAGIQADIECLEGILSRKCDSG
jgi:sugar phosphate isomerase/epimerase